MPRRKQPAGASLGNRSDLARQPAQPVQVPTGLPYGEHQALEQQQQQQPLPAGSPDLSVVPDQPEVMPSTNDQFQQAVSAAEQMQPPGTSTLADPSARPYEHVTASPAGSMLGQQITNLGGLLDSLANQPGATPDVQYLRDVFAGGQV